MGHFLWVHVRSFVVVRSNNASFLGAIEKGMFRSCLLTNLKLVNNFFRKRKTVNYS